MLLPSLHSSGTCRTIPAASPLSRLRLPSPAAASLSSGSGATAPGSGGKARLRIAARNGDAGFGQQLQRRRLGRQRKAEHRVGLAERRGELRVVVGRQPVGLGEQHVVADRGGTEFGQPVGKRCKLRARPRPLPEFAQGRFIDVDDAHRAVGALARQQPLVEVEPHVADGRNRQRIGQPQQGQRDDQHHSEDCRQKPAATHAP